MPKSFKITLTIIFSLFLLLGSVNNVLAKTCTEVGGTCKNLDCSGAAGQADCDPTCPTGMTQTSDTCDPLNYSCCVSESPASTKPTGALTQTPESKESSASGLNRLGSSALIPAIIGGAVKAILGITGAIALLMVVYGAITILISRGGEGVKKGKDILIWAAIGSMVVLGSYVLVDYAITGLEGGGGGGGAGAQDDSKCKAWGKDIGQNATCQTISCPSINIHDATTRDTCIIMLETEKRCQANKCTGTDWDKKFDIVCCYDIATANMGDEDNGTTPIISGDDCYAVHPNNSVCSSLESCPRGFREDTNAICSSFSDSENYKCCYEGF